MAAEGPTPVTTTDVYLAAILAELQALRAVLTPPAPPPPDDLVSLTEPAPRARRTKAGT